ncbi:MAG: VanZ family protein [Bacteroidales bacterium]|nr:VanZ family protein [Bacteroidales bacterium]
MIFALQFFKKFHKTIIWGIAMFYLLFSPSKALPKTGFFNIPHFDKLMHFGMFAILVFLMWLESGKAQNDKNRLRVYFSISAIFFAALSEIVQHNFIAGRSGNVLDFLADLAGFLTGFIFYVFFWHKLIARYRFLQKL